MTLNYNNNSKSSSSFLCEICLIESKSLKLLELHRQTRKHLDKEKFQSDLFQNRLNTKLVCQLCSLALNSEEELVEHLNSETHLTNLDFKNRILKSQSPPTRPEPPLSPPATTMTTTTSLKHQKVVLNQITESLNEQNQIVYECKQCGSDSSFIGAQALLEHLISQDHMHKLNSLIVVNTNNNSEESSDFKDEVRLDKNSSQVNN